MRKMLTLIVALGSIVFVLTVFMYLFPNILWALLILFAFMGMTVLFFYAAIAGFIEWRKVSIFWPTPALACVAFIWLALHAASPLGQRISDRRFERRRGDYTRVVDAFRSKSLLCGSACDGSTHFIEPANLLAHIRDVRGTYCDDGGVIVFFRDESYVPLLHEGYVFKDYKEGNRCGDWYEHHMPYIRHIVGQWYRFSDQPGF